MSGVIYFETNLPLEDRFKLVCKNIEYYFTKIASYDSVLNEFATLKNSLEKIVKESEESSQISRSLARTSQTLKDTILTVNQRVTDESNRQDSKSEHLCNSLNGVKNDLEKHAVNQNNKVDSLNNDFKEALDNYPTLRDVSVIFDQIQLTVCSLKDEIQKVSMDLMVLENEVLKIQDTIQRTQDRQDKQYKDICILQNAMVRLRAEVIK
jgi:chromosome segregation ATPase